MATTTKNDYEIKDGEIEYICPVENCHGGGWGGLENHECVFNYVDDEIDEDVIKVFKQVWYDMRKRCDGCRTILTDENMIKDCEFCQDYCQDCEEDHEYNCAPHNPDVEYCGCHGCECKRLGKFWNGVRAELDAK